MDSKISELAPKIKQVIDSSQNILLHLHPGPDGDSVGSSLAWMHVLKVLGKNVTVISGDDDPPKYLSFLPGFDEIETKSFLEVDQSKFDLFIINDSADQGRVSSKGEYKFADNLKTIMIDHHITNPGFGDIQLVLDRGSNCEILFFLFSELGYEITVDIARCLFVGIFTDTGFKYQNVLPSTFEAAGALVRINSDFWKDIFELENNRTPQEILVERLFLDSIEHHFGDHLVIASMSIETMEKNNLPPKDVHGGLVSNKLKSVVGWDISAVLVEKFDRKTTIGMRTRDVEKYDVSKIALELGGGGHKAAAGVRIDAPLAETKRQLIAAIAKIYPDLGKAS